MKSLKIFTPFGLIFLPSVNGVQTFANQLSFQSISPLLLRKFEFNIWCQNAAGTVNKPIETVNVSLVGSGISFSSPVMQTGGLSALQLDYTTNLQHVSEEYNPGILINPAESTNNITLSFSIFNSTAYVIGDPLTWTAKFYFEEIASEQKANFENSGDLWKTDESIDLGQFYPNQ